MINVEIKEVKGIHNSPALVPPDALPVQNRRVSTASSCPGTRWHPSRLPDRKIERDLESTTGN